MKIFVLVLSLLAAAAPAFAAHPCDSFEDCMEKANKTGDGFIAEQSYTLKAIAYKLAEPSKEE